MPLNSSSKYTYFHPVNRDSARPAVANLANASCEVSNLDQSNTSSDCRWHFRCYSHRRAVESALHSQWSFRGHGRRSGWSLSRFLAVNVTGYVLNCLWVWLIVQRLGGPIELSIVPIVTLTPAFTFLLNRGWTFA